LTLTEVLNPRPKLLRFHMPCPDTYPKHQIKWHGDGRERRFYLAQDMLWEEAELALSPSSVIFGVQI
jgi:hypothetical protein